MNRFRLPRHHGSYDISSSSTAWLRLGRIGASLALTLAVAAAAEETTLRLQQAFLFAADGSCTTIEHYPSLELQPSREPGAAFGLEFDATGLRYPVSSVMFSPDFVRRATPAETPSAAVDLYLVSGDSPRSFSAARAQSHFAGSAVVAFRSARAVARINLADALNRIAPSGRFMVLVAPAGVPGSNPPFALASAPDAFRVFSRPVDRHRELAALMEPLWRGTHTRDEPVIFFADAPKDVPQARLLHRPRQIERIYSYQTGKDYIAGKDWSMAADGTLRALPGTTLPIGTGAGLYPAVVPPGDKSRSTQDGRMLIVNETWSYPLTVMVDYHHDDDWNAPVPAAAPQSLPRTLRKLAAREPVSIVFIGDSIASSGRGSATVMLPPYGPTWPELFIERLRTHFGGEIRSSNRALGSTISSWGAANADYLLAPLRPDLVVIAFGMNDQRKTNPAKFRLNLERMIQATRHAAPAAEFILVSSMVNNPAVNDERALLEFRDEMRKLAGNGIAVADVTAVTRRLLETKAFIDIAVNNFNHPNDYLLRWYAQVAAELLVGNDAGGK